MVLGGASCTLVEHMPYNKEWVGSNPAVAGIFSLSILINVSLIQDPLEVQHYTYFPLKML